MAETQALAEFRRSVQAAEQLVWIDSRGYQDPPHPKNQRAVQGLRGGAAVIMVAAFEEYLRASHEEGMKRLIRGRRKIDFSRLPPTLQVHSVFTTLELAMRGSRYGGPNLDRILRLTDIEVASSIVVSRVVNPPAFRIGSGNPNHEAVKESFKAAGLLDVFRKVKPEFDSRWPTATHETFVQDTLDTIVNRRHQVAHTANALNISRKDLRDAIAFFRVLGPTLDFVLLEHIEACRTVALI